MATSSRFQSALEKHLFNPMVRMSVQIGIAPRAFALLETIGNRSGKKRLTPVGNGLEGSTFWLVSMNGSRSAYVKNLEADPRARVKVRRRWYSGTAVRVSGDDSLARRERLDESNGFIGRLDGKVFKAAATDPTTYRIDLDAAT